MVVKEGKRAVVVRVSGGGGDRDGGSHGSRDGWGQSCRGCGGGGSRRVRRVGARKTAGVIEVAEEEWLRSVWGRRRMKVVLRAPRGWRLGWKDSKEVAQAET